MAFVPIFLKKFIIEEKYMFQKFYFENKNLEIYIFQNLKLIFFSKKKVLKFSQQKKIWNLFFIFKNLDINLGKFRFFFKILFQIFFYDVLHI